MSEKETAPSAILVVDDEQPVLRLCSRLLTSAGFVVDCAEDGVAASEFLATNTYELVITDISMPTMDGIELLRLIRDIDPSLPVILMTGDPSLNSAMNAIQHGVYRYLVKPIEPNDLRTTARQAIEERRAEANRKSGKFYAATTPDSRHASLDAAFERALDTLWIAFQPIISTADHRVFGYDALVRTRETTFPAPSSLFKAAERLDKLFVLGRGVRKKIATALDDAPSDVNILVNLHPHDLNDPSLGDPASPLARCRQTIVFEITERAALQAVDNLGRAIDLLRRCGYRIALDDLGAGYSGLSSFAQLEPDMVKFDMSIVRGVEASPMKQKLIRSMASLCRDIGIEVIAEGVSTIAERDTLFALGCDHLQGFFFAHPAAGFPDISWSGSNHADE